MEIEMVNKAAAMEKVRPYDQWVQERQNDFMANPIRKVTTDSLPSHRNTHKPNNQE